MRVAHVYVASLQFDVELCRESKVENALVVSADDFVLPKGRALAINQVDSVPEGTQHEGSGKQQ